MGGMGGQGGMGRPSSSSIVPSGDDTSPTPTEKPIAAAKKAFAAGMKSLNKAKDYEAAAAAATNPDKRGNAIEKMSDNYNRALDLFTETLANNAEMVEAWNNVGYVHLKLGAFAEAVDDYNHALKLNPSLLDAVEHRGEAYIALDRLEDAKSSYMDLFNHSRPLADQLMPPMQQWLERHRADAAGMRPADIDNFEKWLHERVGIAQQTAAS